LAVTLSTTAACFSAAACFFAAAATGGVPTNVGELGSAGVSPGSLGAAEGGVSEGLPPSFGTVSCDEVSVVVVSVGVESVGVVSVGVVSVGVVSSPRQ
jgi:hypothetical protein